MVLVLLQLLNLDREITSKKTTIIYKPNLERESTTKKIALVIYKQKQHPQKLRKVTTNFIGKENQSVERSL